MSRTSIDIHGGSAAGAYVAVPLALGGNQYVMSMVVAA